jgi:hypothetical protein
MQICRIEHKQTGVGPYQHIWPEAEDQGPEGFERVGWDNGLADPYDSYRCPSPMGEKALVRQYIKAHDGKWRFAFRDLDQMFEWFPGQWAQVLHDAGFHIVILEMKFHVLTALVSDAQVMYQPLHAKKIGTMDLV